jgi:hypothetical protein
MKMVWIVSRPRFVCYLIWTEIGMPRPVIVLRTLHAISASALIGQTPGVTAAAADDGRRQLVAAEITEAAMN